MNELIEAIWNHDFASFQSLMETNPDYAFEKDENGRSLLSWASQVGDLEIMKLLLENGADVNGNDEKTNESPLHNAIIQDNVESAIYLIDNGADIFCEDKEGRSPLHVLANKKAIGLWEDGSYKLLIKLIEYGAKIDSVPIAAALGTMNNLIDLIKSGHDTDAHLEFCLRNALQIATFMNDIELVKYLLKFTNDINWTDYNQMTAVDIATDSDIEALLRNHGGQTFEEIMESINQGQESVRAVQNLVYQINSSKKP